MAKYNTFVVQETKGGRAVLVTSSARKVKRLLTQGLRVEVWSENERVETIYTRTAGKINKYVQAERQYIRDKQARAEARNKARRSEQNAKVN